MTIPRGPNDKRGNGTKHDPEKVAHLLPAYEIKRAEVVARCGAPYNHEFAATFPADPGDHPDAMGYRLEQLRDLRLLDAKLAEALADGFEVIESVDAPIKCAAVIRWGWYVGGTGWQEYRTVRLVPFGGVPGGPMFVLPKGARTRGYPLFGAQVLIKRAS